MGAYIEFGSLSLGQPMSGPLSSLVTRLTYGVTQVPRVAWYLGHSIALRQLANGARRNGSMSKVPDQQPAPVPSRNRLYADMTKLFLRDLANVESGLYPLPIDRDGSLSTLINRSRLFFDDLRKSIVGGKGKLAVRFLAIRPEARVQLITCRTFITSPGKSIRIL
jgi:hypothetical protein